MPRSAASSRMRRITVAPSMPGSTPSTTIASGRTAGRRERRPSSPVAASDDRVAGVAASARRSVSRKVRLSSMTRTVADRSRGAGPRAAARGARATT